MKKLKNFSTFQKRQFFNPFQTTKKNNLCFERRIIGYTPKQVYDVVIDVDKYKEFLPFIEKSQVLKKIKNQMEAELMINYKLGTFSYTSSIDFKENEFVKVSVKDGLFKYLNNNWEFAPGPKEKTCNLYFSIDFEFSSSLYQSLAETFISTSFKTMSTTFETRCQQLYGPPSTSTVILSSHL